MKIAVQLYNFREGLARDFQGTLRKIASIGFDGVEFAGDYGNFSPVALADMLRECGLECAGTMFGVEPLKNANDGAYEYAVALHSPAVTVSWRCDFASMYSTVAETFSRIGDNAARHGLPFSYHNHWWEFVKVGKKTAMEIIMETTDPCKVLLEPDVCWLHRAGVDPAGYLEKYRDRIAQVHLKDILVPDDPSTTVELGRGVIGIADIVKKISTLPLCQWAIYEQDTVSDPFRSAAESLEFLRKVIK